VLKGRRAVCYPGYEGRLDGAILVNEPVVADGHLVTGKGAGAAIAFALKIVEILSGPEISRRLSENMQVYWM
jgi:4-methyl-5(b-hydroxyethyl)-thiazole monophosphate biosynthesis